MRRWNGWGDESVTVELPAHGEAFLTAILGIGRPLPDAGLDSVRARVPASRLADHPLLVTAADDRLRHARGQSLPDWLAMRSGDFGVFPDAVAYPETAAQIRELLAWVSLQDVSLIVYGGGTSVTGHITPQAGPRPILTLSLERMNRLIELDEESQIATFGPGANGPQVESQLRARGFTLGHFPQSWELSTLGGWVASRSSGQQSLRYGRIEQLFAGGILETFAGPLQIPTFPASSAGPDLREMVLGSEGRFGVISEVRVRVTRLPEQEHFHTVFLPAWSQALQAVRLLVQARIPLSMLRLSNALETETQLALAGHPTPIAVLEKYLSWRGAHHGKVMLTFGVTGNRQQNDNRQYGPGNFQPGMMGCFRGDRIGLGIKPDRDINYHNRHKKADTKTHNQQPVMKFDDVPHHLRCRLHKVQLPRFGPVNAICQSNRRTGKESGHKHGHHSDYFNDRHIRPTP